MKSKHRITRFLFLCVSAFPTVAFAQKPDSLAPIRELLQVSNSYRQTPLYLEIEMKNTTNFVTDEQDTLTAVGKIYLLPESSYMQLGELEQFINDSMALIISSRMQRIIVNTKPGNWREQMETFSGSLLKKSSIVELSKKYRGEIKTTKDVSTIELNSRGLVYGTSVPKETMEMQYDPETKKPERIALVRRMLIPLTAEDYKGLKSHPDVDKFLIDIDSKGYFLVKEQTTSFVYKSIVQDTKITIPVSVSDRIVKNNNGQFEPVKAYRDYEITTN